MSSFSFEYFCLLTFGEVQVSLFIGCIFERNKIKKSNFFFLNLFTDTDQSVFYLLYIEKVIKKKKK